MMTVSRVRTAALAVGVLAAGAFLGATYVSARPAEKREIAPLRAGYVSTSDLMQKWKQWQAKAAEMNGRRQQAGIELTGYRATLERKKAAATAAAGDDKARLDREAVEAQRTFEDAERSARTEIDRDSGKILGEFSKRCQAEIAAMAKDLNLDVVYFCPITPQSIADKQLAPPQLDLYFRPPALMPAYLKDGLDLTNELVERLNKAGNSFARPAADAAAEEGEVSGPVASIEARRGLARRVVRIESAVGKGVTVPVFIPCRRDNRTCGARERVNDSEGDNRPVATDPPESGFGTAMPCR